MSLGPPNDHRSSPTPTPTGSGFVLALSILLTLTSLLQINAALAARRGESGTEFVGLVLQPIQLLAVLGLIATLLHAAFSKRTPPPRTRLVRLTATLIAFGTLFLTFVV